MTEPRAMDCETVRELAPLYVLGVLEADEAAAVREHVAACDDVHAELQEHAEAAGSLLLAAEPAEPPAALKSRLLAAAEADLREGRHPATARVAAPEPDAAPTPEIVPARPFTPKPVPAPAPAPVDIRAERERRRFRLALLGAAAAILLAVALGGYAVVLRGQLSDEEAYRQAVDQALQLATEPGSATAVLAGSGNASSGLGVIAADGHVELAMRGLSPTPGRVVYTAWAIGADGAPKALGDFEVGGSGTGTTTGTSPLTGAGTVLAITLEPQPGATAPGGPIVASGSATSPQG
jgi:anti-sigma-K factor RskA